MAKWRKGRRNARQQEGSSPFTSYSNMFRAKKDAINLFSSIMTESSLLWPFVPSLFPRESRFTTELWNTHSNNDKGCRVTFSKIRNHITRCAWRDHWYSKSVSDTRKSYMERKKAQGRWLSIKHSLSKQRLAWKVWLSFLSFMSNQIYYNPPVYRLSLDTEFLYHDTKAYSDFLS